jgi:hypothetical protein
MVFIPPPVVIYKVYVIMMTGWAERDVLSSQTRGALYVYIYIYIYIYQYKNIYTCI